MARQNINVNSSQKLFEAFMDFSGGLNSEVSNESLRDNEFPVLQNVDLDRRGSVRSRTGRTKVCTIPGKPQGTFFYYRLGAAVPDMIVASGGKLYRVQSDNTVTELVIKNGDDTFTFQDKLPIEGVQYRATLYIATGTKLVEVYFKDDVWTAKVAVPYTPTVQEAIHIGTNGLADDPDAYIQDGTDVEMTVLGIKPTLKTGTINVPAPMTAFLNRRAGYAGTIDFKWEYRQTATTAFTLVKDWTTSNNHIDMSFTNSGAFDVKVTVREEPVAIANVALNTEIATTFPTADPAHLPPQINDGDVATGWQATGYYGYVTLDLGKKMAITRWVVKHAHSDGTTDKKYNTRDFAIEFSDDGSSFTTADIVSGNTDDVTDRTIASTGGRYVRLWVSTPTQSDADYTNRIQIQELELYGVPFDPPVEKSYILTGYQVNPTSTVQSNPSDGLQMCRHILLHWDRIIMYGDPKYPYQIHISDLENPYYFPVDMTVNFDTGKQEPISSIIRFQDMLVIFTKTTIQTMTGKSPDDYARFHIHDGLGAVAPRSVQVVGNNIIFLSHEGVFYLKPNQYRLEALNVSRVDAAIKSEVPVDFDACSTVNGAQYWLCMPNTKVLYRFYYETGVWTKDVGGIFDFNQFLQYGEQVYNLSNNGNLYRHDPTVYKDDGATYTVIIESRYMDFSSSFNYKKLKKLFILGKHYLLHNVDLRVYVFADAAIALTPESGYATVNQDTGYVEWVASVAPNFHFHTGTTFGIWQVGESPFGDVNISVQKTAIRGKCRRTKIRLVYDGGDLFEIYGYGFQFAPKKP